jgi:nucleotide-binding universal stress UspA family protein
LTRSSELEPVHKTIVNYLVNGSEKEYIDFVAVGNQGADFSSHIDKRYLGSVANGVIRTPKLNVLFIPSKPTF